MDKVVELGSYLVVSGHSFAADEGMVEDKVEGLKHNFEEELPVQSKSFAEVVGTDV